MKKYLIPEKGNFYKAAMHIHTNISDGKLSPEEMKKVYISKGYSIIAFTDHVVFVPHNDLTDENFLSINSVEISVSNSYIGDIGGWEYLPTYHMNLYAKKQDIDYTSVCTKDSIYVKHSMNYMTEKMLANKFVKEYRPECINELTKAAIKEGFLVCYNHPVGGLQNYKDYSELKNLWAVEWFNAGATSGGTDETIQPVEDLLRLKERVFPIAGDDAHDAKLVGKCFTMVKAEKLHYETVMQALEDGAFYSSTGPEIYEMYIEDGFLHIKCSDVKKIVLKTERRVSFTNEAEEGKTVNEAIFDLRKYEQNSNIIEGNYEKAYVRLTLTDDKGNQAQTVPYFLTDIADSIKGA